MDLITTTLLISIIDSHFRACSDTNLSTEKVYFAHAASLLNWRKKKKKGDTVNQELIRAYFTASTRLREREKKTPLISALCYPVYA